MKTPWRMLLPLLALCLVAGAKKPKCTVGFYTEAASQDTSTFAVPVTLQYAKRKAFVSKIPAISERNIRAIYLFPAQDGSFGCSFALDQDGRIKLDTLSVEKRNTSLVAVVNGAQVIDLLIDKRIDDGVITIPRGLTVEEARSLRTSFPLLNPPKTQPPAGAPPGPTPPGTQALPPGPPAPRPLQ